MDMIKTALHLPMSSTAALLPRLALGPLTSTHSLELSTYRSVLHRTPIDTIYIITLASAVLAWA